MNQNLYWSRLLEFLRIFKNLAQLGIHLKICIKYIKKYISCIFSLFHGTFGRMFMKFCTDEVLLVVFSTRFKMLFGRMCNPCWSHLFLIGSLTSIQLLLGFQRKFAERKYSTCLKSCVCFSCCSVYKDDRPGF